MGPALASLAHGLVATVSCSGIGQVTSSCTNPGSHHRPQLPQTVENQEPGPELELSSMPTPEDKC